ncbi:hypothetical protein [Lactiplantibacillus plantarum]|uniref:hypothetical protein n=1 Tax=Lactiplantibacillus plantarum TaxID=1590 RepID=UPI00295A9A66|nr:hypothetical protein [Lactiplantibacillus plantarum]MDV9115436.1 hypothetical protein [Lactiplantibacillus plantarum]
MDLTNKQKNIKVAKIIDDTSLVINAGENQGVKKNDRFQIIGKFGTEPVIDPDTKESLGTLDDIKATVIAYEIFPNMTVCKSKYIEDDINISKVRNIQANSIANITEMINQVRDGSIKYGHHESLNVDETQVTGGFKKSDTPIKVGDFARKVN